MSVCITSCVLLTLVLIVLAASLASRGHHNHLSSLPIVAHVRLFVDDSAPVATVDENFVCATIDWWPPEKCNYGSCSWPQSSILNLDLRNSRLENSVKALSPLLIRLGGSLQDQVIYNVSDSAVSCNPFRTTADFIRFGFSTGCLSMSRWQELNEFFQRTGSLVAFGLNALHGRQRSEEQFKGPWNSSNARDFISYTYKKGYQIKAWELGKSTLQKKSAFVSSSLIAGNEISGGAGGTRLDPKQFAADVKELQKIINDVYADSKPIVVAPDGFFEHGWYDQFLKHSKTDRESNAVGIHIYNLGPGNGKNITGRILTAPYTDTYRQVQDVIRKNGNAAKAWVGEAGGIYNGGQHLVSDTFVFSFWYLDQLGQAALHNAVVFCRQSLIGGNYGLLDSKFNPNPDFYAALLWKKVMGEAVLNVTSSNRNSSTVRAYAHCLKGSRGGVAMLILNFSDKVEQAVEFPVEMNSDKQEYHLSSSGNVQSSKLMLNGRSLETSRDGSLPELKAMTVKGSIPTQVAPYTIAFIVFQDVLFPVCTL